MQTAVSVRWAMMVTMNSRLTDPPCILMSQWIQLKPHNCDYILPISLIFICCAKGFKISGTTFLATSFSLLDLIELRCGPGDLETEMEQKRKEKHRQRNAEHKYIPGQNYVDIKKYKKITLVTNNHRPLDTSYPM